MRFRYARIYCILKSQCSSSPYQSLYSLCFIPTQISSADHPFVDHPLSPIQKLCHEAEYYLNIVLKGKRDQILENECYFGSIDEPNSSQPNISREKQAETLNVSDDNSPTPEVQDGVNNNGLTCSQDQPSGNNNGIACSRDQPSGNSNGLTCSHDQPSGNNDGLTCSHDQPTGNSNTIHIKLTELLKFPRITALCSSSEEIRCDMQLCFLMYIPVPVVSLS